MSRARRISGRKSKQNGKNFERLIERTCAYYKSKGIADINKTPEPLRPIGTLNNGQFRAIYAKKGQPDFLGTLKGGRSIMFEAKHTESTNIRFDRVAPHQKRDLQNTYKLGGLSLVIISFRFENFYAVEWSRWLELQKTTRKKSVNEKDLEPYKIDTTNGYLHFIDSEWSE